MHLTKFGGQNYEIRRAPLGLRNNRALAAKNTANNVAPSVNVKETANGYTVELAAPGVKKEYCRVHVDEDHNLCVAIS